MEHKPGGGGRLGTARDNLRGKKQTRQQKSFFFNKINLQF